MELGEPESSVKMSKRLVAYGALHYAGVKLELETPKF